MLPWFSQHLCPTFAQVPVQLVTDCIVHYILCIVDLLGNDGQNKERTLWFIPPTTPTKHCGLPPINRIHVVGILFIGSYVNDFPYQMNLINLTLLVLFILVHQLSLVYLHFVLVDHFSTSRCLLRKGGFIFRLMFSYVVSSCTKLFSLVHHGL